MAQITQFNTGYCTHPECVVSNAFSLKNKSFPAKAWLIETSGKNYLWDTGYSEHFFQKQWNHQVYRLVTPVHIEEHLVSLLAKHGLEQTDINAIFISHLHADHCAGLLDFPISQIYLHQHCESILKENSTIKLLMKGCLPHLYQHTYKSAFLAYFNVFEYASLPRELMPFDKGYKVAEDFYIVDLPGHAIGHVGAFIHDGEKWVLLASDSAWLHEAYQDNIYPSFVANTIMHDRMQYEGTLLKIQELHRNSGCEIILSHA